MSTYDVSGKYAIVTGAGSGISLAFTEQLLERGCSVLLADLKLRPEAEEVVARYATSAGEGGPKAVFHRVDLTDWAQISSMWAAALAAFPQVDVVFNGAGILDPPGSSFWDPPRDAGPDGGQYRSFAVNAEAPIRIAQIAIDYWLRNRHVRGNLLCVASVAGYVHNLHYPLYFASKAAVVSFVRSMALLRENFGIRTAAVCPGAVHVSTTKQAALINMKRVKYANRGDDKTPLTTLLDHCKDMIHPEDLGMTPQQCASVMVQVLTEPQYGDGNTVEIMMVGSKEDPNISVRDVPLEILYPATGVLGPDNHVVEEEAKFVKHLQQQYGLQS